MGRERAVVIGGGVIGCTAAGLLADAGWSVTLVEATAIAAGASGRNSGTIQHPFDPVLLGLHRETVPMYRELANADPDFAFPASPAGVLLLTDDLAAAGDRAAELAAEFPELRPEVMDADAVHAADPAVAPQWHAVRLETGYPVVPDAATRALARRAILAGVTVRIGTEARPWVEDGRLRGVTLGGGETLSASHVLVAAGPWTPEILEMDPPWPAVTRTWGVTVQVEVRTPPRHVLEEGVVHTVNDPAGIAEPLFSAITVDGTATVGSTFLAEAPRPEAMAPVLLARGESFVPGLSGAAVREIRLCARPQSADGRPFIGPVPGVEGLSVCVGHGPWGMSTGPASAAMAVEAMTGGADRVPPALRADRVVRIA